MRGGHSGLASASTKHFLMKFKAFGDALLTPWACCEDLTESSIFRRGVVEGTPVSAVPSALAAAVSPERSLPRSLRANCVAGKSRSIPGGVTFNIFIAREMSCCGLHRRPNVGLSARAGGNDCGASTKRVLSEIWVRSCRTTRRHTAAIRPWMLQTGKAHSGEGRRSTARKGSFY
jgi:hypothetical protein